MLEQLKATYGGDVRACLQAGIDSTITSPTTRARLEWALEQFDRYEDAVNAAYGDGYTEGFAEGYGQGDYD